MGQPATLVVDIETVGQDPETIPARAREILLDVETEEERLKVLDCLGLDPVHGQNHLYRRPLDRTRQIPRLLPARRTRNPRQFLE